MTALNRYATSVYRKESAKKRCPLQGLAQLDGAVIPDLPISDSKRTPELVFYYTWATNLLDQVLIKIRDEYSNTGRITYWEVFQATVCGTDSRQRRTSFLI